MPRAIVFSLKLAACVATVFVVFGGFQFGYSPPVVAFLAIAGAVLGAIAAPYFEPKAFRYPTLWQMFFSVIGCVLIAMVLRPTSEGYALAIVAGCAIGYLARYWIPHV